MKTPGDPPGLLIVMRRIVIFRNTLFVTGLQTVPGTYGQHKLQGEAEHRNAESLFDEKMQMRSILFNLKW